MDRAGGAWGVGGATGLFGVAEGGGSRFGLCSTMEWGKLESRECSKWPLVDHVKSRALSVSLRLCYVGNLMTIERTDTKIRLSRGQRTRKHG